MRKLTLDETWDYTKRMWEWVAFQVEVLKDKRGVELLKKVWLEECAPEFQDIKLGCFFCERTDGHNCDTCPGRLIAPEFDCQGADTTYHYFNKPGAFCREIFRLDAIRTTKPSEPAHVWKHGDVFRNIAGVQIYCLHEIVELVINLDSNDGGFGTPEVQLEDAEFLFNIKDRLNG